ncbi:MAG: protein YgfX [Candidatus Methylumidiphilus sp.]
MPPKSAACPYLAPKPSRAFRAYLLGIHALSFLAASINPWPFSALLSLAVLLSLSLTLRAKPQITGFKLKPDGSWRLDISDNGEIEAVLLPSSLFNTGFALLHFQAETRRYALLVCRDSLEVEDFRQLRVAMLVAGGRASEDHPVK